jgi:hypothetical protein
VLAGVFAVAWAMQPPARPGAAGPTVILVELARPGEADAALDVAVYRMLEATRAAPSGRRVGSGRHP